MTLTINTQISVDGVVQANGGRNEILIIHVAPVLVGDGVRLFERLGGQPVKLEPMASVDEGGVTILRSSVSRS
jgi:hypothetical protein